jgi:hypothetical protein
MPKLAADVIAYSRARAGGAREDAAEEAKLNAFIDYCGQSLDWIFDGNVGGLICKAAANSPQSEGLSKSPEALAKMQQVSTPLSDLETPFFQVRHLALAARMMGSSDEMPKEEGAALDTVADRIITIMDELIAERDRIWVLSRKAAFPE